MSLCIKFRQISCISFNANLSLLYFRRINTTCSVQSLNSRLRRIGSSVEKERNFILKDKIPQGYELIYRAPMEYYLGAAQHATTASATFIAGLAAYNSAMDVNFVNMPYEAQFGHLVAHESDIWWFAAGFIAINIAIRYFVAKYPLRIYKNEGKYLAVYNSQIPFRTFQHKFDRGNVAEVQNILNPWRDLTFRLGNRTSLLLLDYFRTPSEFHIMCGSN